MLGLRELRGEIVSRLNGAAMEVLGFEDTPESQFRDEGFNKLEHPGFIDLLEDNKFLGIGDEYLCSSQIVKVRQSGYIIFCLTQMQLGSPRYYPWPRFHSSFEKSISLKNEPLWSPNNPTNTPCICSNCCKLPKVNSSIAPDCFVDILPPSWDRQL